MKYTKMPIFTEKELRNPIPQLPVFPPLADNHLSVQILITNFLLFL